MIAVDTTCRANRPGDTPLLIDGFAHMVAPVGAPAFTDAFAMKCVLLRFRVKQNSVVFARIAFLRAPSRLILPDNFVFEASPIGMGIAAKDIVQHYPGVVGDAPIQVNIEATVGRK